MPKVKETWMDVITTEMMEHICDDLCKYPDHLSGEALEDKCAEYKMGRFVCDILNQYNKINDFTSSQCAKLLEQMHELKERDTAKKPIKTNDDTGILIAVRIAEGTLQVQGFQNFVTIADRG